MRENKWAYIKLLFWAACALNLAITQLIQRDLCDKATETQLMKLIPYNFCWQFKACHEIIHD